MRRWFVLWFPRPRRDLPEDLLPEIRSISRQLTQTLNTLQQFERRLNALAELTKAEEADGE